MASITEALAEIKTIGKRLEKKREFYNASLMRQEAIKDPLHAGGGSEVVLEREAQAIHDLEERVVFLRGAISRANAATEMTICGTTRTMTDWLTWRKEVAPSRQTFLAKTRQVIATGRNIARNQGSSVVSPNTASAVPNDIVINISETKLSADIEQMEEILGTLDGQLSLKNATTMITE